MHTGVCFFHVLSLPGPLCKGMVEALKKVDNPWGRPNKREYPSQLAKWIGLLARSGCRHTRVSCLKPDVQSMPMPTLASM